MYPDFKKQSLIPAIAQDDTTNKVLMLAYMNIESYEKTLETGYAHYFSRSRQKIWKKGETSGHIQKIMTIYLDCDQDAILLKVQQAGSACHTNNKTCFFHKI